MMKLYFTFLNIPELVGLTRPRRKAIYQCALEALFHEQPGMLTMSSRLVFGGILVGAAAGWVIAFASGSSHMGLITVACALAGLAVGNSIGAHILHTRLRPYLRRVLEERKEEIEQIK